MKYTVLALFFVLSLCSVRSNAQQAAPIVTAGGVKYEQINGHWNPAITTCAVLLSDPRLEAKDGWKVWSYTIGFRPVGKDYVGPFFVKGASFTSEVKEALKDQMGGKGEIDIESIKVSSPDQGSRTASSIKLKYNN